MAADGSLIFNTKIDQSGFDKGTRVMSNGVNKLKGSLKSLAKTAAASMPFSKIGGVQKNINGLSGSLKSLAAVAAAAFSVKQIVDFAKASKEAYNVQIEQETKLTTIMRQRMGATDEEIQSVKQLAAEQQKLGVIGDEVQLAGAQQVATFLNETDSIKTLLPAMNDLLAQQNGLNASESDAVNIGNLMGKVMQGQTSALKRVGISFSEAEEQVLKYGSESEKAAMLAEVITNNVGHMNQELAKTDAGKQKQLANTMGDIKEQFGQAVSQIQTAFLPVLSRLVSWFSKAASVAQSFSSAIRSAFGVEADNNSATVATTTATSAADAADSYEDMADSAEKTKKSQENSLASFDKVIKIGKQESKSSSSSSGGGKKGGTSVVTLPKPKISKASSWADELKKAIKKGDWESVGATFADKINKVFGKVNWDKVKTKVTSGAKKISDGINGFVKRFNWKGAGETLGNGITTAFSAAYAFLKNTKWREIGSGIAEFLNGLMKKTDFKKIGATLGAKLNAIIGLAFGFASKFNWDEAGLGLADIINGWFDEVDWDALGDTLGTLVQGIISLAFNFVSSLDFAKMAKSFATAFNKFIKKINFRQLGQTVSKAFIGVWTFIGTAIKEIDWKQVGKSISEFINGIDWWGILKSLFGVIGSVLKAAPQFLLGVVKNLDFANAAGAFALLFGPKIAKKLLSTFVGDSGVVETLKSAGSTILTKIGTGIKSVFGKLTEVGGKIVDKIKSSTVDKAEGIGSSFGSKLSKGLGTAGAVVGAAIAGWQIGTMIYNAAKPGIDKITDAIQDLTHAEERAKGIDQEAKMNANKTLNKYKKQGFTYLNVDDVLNETKAFRKARKILQFVQDYGYSVSEFLYNNDLYEQAMEGKLKKKSKTTQEHYKTVSERIQDKKISDKVKELQKDPAWRNVEYKYVEKRARALLGLPALATGTVVPANYGHFAAILGDNKKEPEVVSPLSTMKQAVLEALALQGKPKQPVNVYLEIDTRNGKRLLSKQIIDDINDIIDSTGKVPIKINV